MDVEITQETTRVEYRAEPTARGTRLGAVVDGDAVHLQYEGRGSSGTVVVEAADLAALTGFLERLYAEEDERRGGVFEPEVPENDDTAATTAPEVPDGGNEPAVEAPPIVESQNISVSDPQPEHPESSDDQTENPVD